MKTAKISNGVKNYETLEHPADLKIKILGENKEELFKNAFMSLTEALKPEKEKGGIEKERVIEIRSTDLPNLLVDFLSEILYLSQVKKEVYKDIKFRKFPGDSKDLQKLEIKADLIGQRVRSFGEDIKAVTYHDLEIRQKSDDSFEATVLFDV